MAAVVLAIGLGYSTITDRLSSDAVAPSFSFGGLRLIAR